MKAQINVYEILRQHTSKHTHKSYMYAKKATDTYTHINTHIHKHTVWSSP